MSFILRIVASEAAASLDLAGAQSRPGVLTTHQRTFKEVLGPWSHACWSLFGKPRQYLDVPKYELSMQRVPLCSGLANASTTTLPRLIGLRSHRHHHKHGWSSLFHKRRTTSVSANRMLHLEWWPTDVNRCSEPSCTSCSSSNKEADILIELCLFEKRRGKHQ